MVHDVVGPWFTICATRISPAVQMGDTPSLMGLLDMHGSNTYVGSTVTDDDTLAVQAPVENDVTQLVELTL